MSGERAHPISLPCRETSAVICRGGTSPFVITRFAMAMSGQSKTLMQYSVSGAIRVNVHTLKQKTPLTRVMLSPR